MAEDAHGFVGAVPHLHIKDGRAAEASDFYVKAFGAKELMRLPAPDGKRLMHCRLAINGGSLMLADEFVEYHGALPPPAGCTLHLQVEDVDVVWAQAIAAGAVETMPLALQFWGDRYGQVQDPFGHKWSIASTPKG